MKKRRKNWKENNQKIKRYIEAHGYLTHKEIAKATGLGRNTVSRHMQVICQKEEFDKDEKTGRKYFSDWKKNWLETSSLPPIPPNPYIFFTSRLTPEDRKKDSKKIMEGKTEGRKIGAIYICTQQDFERDMLGSVALSFRKEFLYANPYWLRDLFRYALREELIDEKYFSGEREETIEDIPNEELDLLWSRLFGETETFMLVLNINPQELLKWIKGKGKRDLSIALSKDICEDLYREASKLRKQRKEWDKKGLRFGLPSLGKETKLQKQLAKTAIDHNIKKLCLKCQKTYSPNLLECPYCGSKHFTPTSKEIETKREEWEKKLKPLESEGKQK